MRRQWASPKASPVSIAVYSSGAMRCEAALAGFARALPGLLN